MRNKFHNIKTGGFDSLKEARRYNELFMLQKAGYITELQTQVKYELIPPQYETYERYGKSGKRLMDGLKVVERGVDYIADFVYTENGKKIVEDTKGYKKGAAYDLFVIKRKLMLERHGIRIREV